MRPSPTRAALVGGRTEELAAEAGGRRRAGGAHLGINPIVTLEKQPLNMIGNLV